MDTLEKHVAALEKDGYTIIPNALSQDEIAAALRATRELLSAEEAVAQRTGTQTENLRAVHTIVGKHPTFYEFFLNPPVVRVVRKMIGNDMVLYDANLRAPMPTGGREKRSGFQVHVDREDYSVLPFVGGEHYPMAMNVTWCLVDFTIENGCTLLWPRSHRSGQVPEPESRPPGYIYAEVPAGSAIIWDAAVWHVAGINHSNSPRYSVLAYYQRSWIKGKADSQRFIPAKARATLSEETKRLLGFRSAVSDYSEVKALSPQQIEALTLEEKKVLGFGIY